MYYYIFFLIAIAHSYPNQTKFKLQSDPVGGSIDFPTKIKIVLSGKSPFETILYTTTGIPLRFKGTKVSYTGNPTFYVIKNIDSEPNKITLDIYEIDTDWTKICTIGLAIGTIFVLVLYKREHWMSQICLIILLTIEIFKTSDYDRIADRIIHKILF